MRRYRPDAVTSWLLVALLLVALLRLLGCARPGMTAFRGHGGREQPAALVGLWRMEPASDSGTLLVLRREPAVWWWVEQPRASEAPRLCLHWRPGRRAADCAPYRIDTLASDSGRVVRLTWGDRRFVATPR